MKTHSISLALCMLLLASVAVLSASGQTTFEIGGVNAIGNTELLREYGMELGNIRVGQTTYPSLTLRSSVVSSEAIGIKYSSSDTQPLYIIVNGICVIESTGDCGLVTNQNIFVTGTGSLYIKGTKGVFMQTQTNISIGAIDGVELICEGTNGAGIEGSPHPRIKNEYLGAVAVRGENTSLIVKGTTYAMAAINMPLYQDGAAIQYPSGLSFENHAYATSEWMHVTATGLPINSTYIPDAVFRNFVNHNYDSHEPDGYLSRYERSLVSTMNVFQKGISDLTGVNYFTSLTSLNCGANSSASIDISALTKLEDLQCYSTGLRSIDLSHNTKLKTVDLSFNTLTALDVSHNTKLTVLKCQSHFFETLDVSMCPDLELLDINARTNARMLTSLNVEGCAKLEDLNCGCGKLTSLDVSSCTALKRLQCDYNTLTTLNVAGLTNLYFIQCSVNSLSSLDLTGCTAMELLYCGNNPIAQLDFSDCTGLKRLSCRNNLQLGQLDVSGLQLTELDCFNCPLLTMIDCSNNQLEEYTPINVQRCNALREVRCQRNKLAGAALDSLISFLPTITTEGTIYLTDEDNGDENVCTTEQAIALYNKGWNALRYADGEWKPFEAVVIADGLRYKCILSNVPAYPAVVVGVENPSTSVVTFADSVTVPGIEAPFAVTTIGANAFKGVSNLRNITIPDFITTIEPWAFDGCRLTKATIPASVTHLCDSAFVRCNVLWDLFVQWPDPLPIAEGTDPFPHSKGGCVLHVPFGAYGYQTDPYWSRFKSVETEGAQVVDEQGIVYNCYIDENGENAYAEVCGLEKQTVTPNRIDIAEHVTYEVAGVKTSFPVTHIASTAFQYSDNRVPSHVVVPA
ncbi:MAG: leucine-rich repeat protein, partial [Bacteroidaceae bacterium]|nr:leucine-rich repeat protein [Bacteroidaceae bacterium]